MAKKAAKKASKKATKKPAKKAGGRTASGKYSFLDDVLERVTEIAAVSKDGSVKIKRVDMKRVLEEAFENASLASAGGEKVRFPVIGSLIRRDIPARKAGAKGRNPATGEEITLKARPASKKPRWSFPKALKEAFANKKYW